MTMDVTTTKPGKQPPVHHEKVRYLAFAMLILLFLVVAQTCSNPIPRSTATPSPSPHVTPSPVVLEGQGFPGATPLPAELLENRDQTNGIILGSAILVLIIIGGTLSVLLRRRKD